MKKGFIIFITVICFIIAIVIGVRFIMASPYKARIEVHEIGFNKNAQNYAYDKDVENNTVTLTESASEFDNYIYFIEPSTKDLYKIDKEFENKEVVINGEIEGFLFKNGKLYYLENEKLHCVDMSTMEDSELAGNYPDDYIKITDESIFFLNHKKRLFKADLTGQNAHKLCGGKISLYSIRGDKVFYTIHFKKIFQDYFLLYAMNDDGTNSHLLVNLDTDGWFDIVDNNVYFGRYIDNKIYRFSLLQPKIYQVNDIDYVYSLITSGDRIYYRTRRDLLVSNSLEGGGLTEIDTDVTYLNEPKNRDLIIYTKQYPDNEVKIYNPNNNEAVTLLSISQNTFVRPAIFDDNICLELIENHFPEENKTLQLYFYNFQGELMYTAE